MSSALHALELPSSRFPALSPTPPPPTYTPGPAPYSQQLDSCPQPPAHPCLSCPRTARPGASTGCMPLLSLKLSWLLLSVAPFFPITAPSRPSALQPDSSDSLHSYFFLLIEPVYPFTQIQLKLPVPMLILTKLSSESTVGSCYLRCSKIPRKRAILHTPPGSRASKRNCGAWLTVGLHTISVGMRCFILLSLKDLCNHIFQKLSCVT